MPLSGATEDDNPQVIPLPGGARAVRPRGRSRTGTNPPRRFATAVASRHPSKEGIFRGG